MKDKITYRIALVLNYCFQRKHIFKQVGDLLWWMWFLVWPINAAVQWTLDPHNVKLTIGVFMWMLILTLERQTNRRRFG